MGGDILGDDAKVIVHEGKLEAKNKR